MVAPWPRCDRKFAVLVKGAVRPGRRHDDRTGIGLAEQFHAHVDLADIDQAPRPQLKFLEALAVGAQGDLVVDARSHVAEMRRRQVLVRHELEIEDIDGVARRSDQLLEQPRPPQRGIGQALQFLGQCLAAGEQRARGKELQEAATIGPRAIGPLAIGQCASAHLISFPTKASHESICDLATNSLGWCACEMSPGPQITVGMPWPRKIPASVP